MQPTLRSVADAKRDNTQTVSAGDLVSDADQLMAKRNIGAVVAVNDDEDVGGILSERDPLIGSWQEPGRRHYADLGVNYTGSAMRRGHGNGTRGDTQSD